MKKHQYTDYFPPEAITLQGKGVRPRGQGLEQAGIKRPQALAVEEDLHGAGIVGSPRKGKGLGVENFTYLVLLNNVIHPGLYQGRLKKNGNTLASEVEAP